MMLPWILCLSLVIPMSTIVAGFPQDDRIVFDGPTSGPRRTTDRTPATPPPSMTTAPPPPELQFNACLERCPVTPEYNPICGTDNVDYNNPGSLYCATMCGKVVTLRHYGKCTSMITRG